MPNTFNDEDIHPIHLISQGQNVNKKKHTLKDEVLFFFKRQESPQSSAHGKFFNDFVGIICLHALVGLLHRMLVAFIFIFIHAHTSN